MQVQANHEETRRAIELLHDETQRQIAGVQQSQRDAIAARNGQLAHVADKIEAIETDLGRVEGQMGFFIKTRQP